MSVNDFVLVAVCYVDDVVLVVASVVAVEDCGRRGSCKTENRSVMMDKSIVVHGLVVLCEEGAGICGVEGVFGRKCQIRDCTRICSRLQVFGEVETRSEFFMVQQESYVLTL